MVSERLKVPEIQSPVSCPKLCPMIRSTFSPESIQVLAEAYWIEKRMQCRDTRSSIGLFWKIVGKILGRPSASQVLSHCI